MPKALIDVDQAAALDPKGPYPALWLEIRAVCGKPCPGST
jgi:hypothetical protein